MPRVYKKNPDFDRTPLSLVNVFVVGVVNSKKLSSSKLFSTEFGPKLTDQPRIFPVASIWSCTVASNLQNASNLWSSKFDPKRNSFQCCIMGVKYAKIVLGTGRDGQFAQIIVKFGKKMTNPTGPGTFFKRFFTHQYNSKRIFYSD